MRQNCKPKYILYHKITLVYLLDNQSIHNISFRKNDMRLEFGTSSWPPRNIWQWQVQDITRPWRLYSYWPWLASDCTFSLSKVSLWWSPLMRATNTKVTWTSTAWIFWGWPYAVSPFQRIPSKSLQKKFRFLLISSLMDTLLSSSHTFQTSRLKLTWVRWEEMPTPANPVGAWTCSRSSAWSVTSDFWSPSSVRMSQSNWKTFGMPKVNEIKNYFAFKTALLFCVNVNGIVWSYKPTWPNSAALLGQIIWVLI